MSENIRGHKFLTKIKDLDYSPSLTHLHILGLLLISGLLIKSYVAMSTSLWHDETITANAAISLLQNGVPDFPSGFVYWRAFPHTLLTAASGYLFGVTDYTMRFPSIILSSLTVILTYLTGKQFFDRDTGLIASAFVTFSALQVAWATQVRMYVLLQFLYLLTVLLIYRSVERKKNIEILGLVLVLVISSFVHITSQILPFVAIGYWLYRTEIFNTAHRIKTIGTPVLILATIVALEFSSTVSFVQIFSRLTFKPENIYYYYDLVFKQIPILTILGLIGSILALRKNLRPGILMVISVFPALCIYLLYVDGVSERYIFFSVPFLAIWTALTIKSSSLKAKEIIGNKVDKNIDFKIIAVILTLLTLLVGSGFDFSEGQYRPEIDEKSVYNYIEDNADQSDILITQWTPPATYYYKPPDYSLYGDNSTEGYNSSFYREEYSYKEVDVYSGAEFIDSNVELIDVIAKNDKGWIVLRDESYKKKSDEIKRTLSSLYSVKEFEGLKLWKWNTSVSRSDNLSLKNQ